MQTEQIKKIADKIKGIRTTMFVTMMENNVHRGRPMATQEVEFDGDVWFMTHKGSQKVKDIKNNPNVALMYGDAGVKFLSLSGTAEFSEDKQKIKEFWNDFYKAWFENEDDPNITLIKVSVSRAEYWNYKGGKVGAYVDMAKAAVTGAPMDNDEHGVFTK